MKDFFNKVASAFSADAATTALTIIFFFVLFFYLINLLQRNNARWMIAVMIAYVAITGVIFMLVGEENKQPLTYFFVLAPMVLTIFILFATEIKRDIWDLGAKKVAETKHVIKNSAAAQNVNHCIDEIVKAVQNMSKNDVGAIIILANGNMPKTIIDSGVIIDSEISSALIESIFFPKPPLHDGAMVINGSKVHAAGCFLPLSQEVNLPKELGTRHRAGIGITETISVTSLIVSEETGIISIAQGGKIKRYVDSEMLRQALKEYYWQELLEQKD